MFSLFCIFAMCLYEIVMITLTEHTFKTPVYITEMQSSSEEALN